MSLLKLLNWYVMMGFVGWWLWLLGVVVVLGYCCLWLFWCRLLLMCCWLILICGLVVLIFWWVVKLFLVCVGLIWCYRVDG